MMGLSNAVLELMQSAVEHARRPTNWNIIKSCSYCGHTGIMLGLSYAVLELVQSHESMEACKLILWAYS